MPTRLSDIMPIENVYIARVTDGLILVSDTTHTNISYHPRALMPLLGFMILVFLCLTCSACFLCHHLNIVCTIPPGCINGELPLPAQREDGPVQEPSNETNKQTFSFLPSFLLLAPSNHFLFSTRPNRSWRSSVPGPLPRWASNLTPTFSSKLFSCMTSVCHTFLAQHQQQQCHIFHLLRPLLFPPHVLADYLCCMFFIICLQAVSVYAHIMTHMLMCVCIYSLQCRTYICTSTIMYVCTCVSVYILYNA